MFYSIYCQIDAGLNGDIENGGKLSFCIPFQLRNACTRNPEIKESKLVATPFLSAGCGGPRDLCRTTSVVCPEAWRRPDFTSLRAEALHQGDISSPLTGKRNLPPNLGNAC